MTDVSEIDNSDSRPFRELTEKERVLFETLIQGHDNVSLIPCRFNGVDTAIVCSETFDPEKKTMTLGPLVIFVTDGLFDSIELPVNVVPLDKNT